MERLVRADSAKEATNLKIDWLLIGLAIFLWYVAFGTLDWMTYTGYSLEGMAIGYILLSGCYLAGGVAIVEAIKGLQK
ncbi:MAG TPA: hypothetical protein VEP90_05505 [Methylomirabilota bacterium]|nr:hypothetical protein [Methylomirabilota bacterium]